MIFQATLDIIGINPFVFVPDEILQAIFAQAGKDRGYIPVRGLINNRGYRQTLVKYKGDWRLYVNTIMLKDSPGRIGELVRISIEFDPESREIEPPASFVQALMQEPQAKDVFDGLPPSRRKEIVRYLANLKTPDSLERNVKKAIGFLMGKERFIGRDKP